MVIPRLAPLVASFYVVAMYVGTWEPLVQLLPLQAPPGSHGALGLPLQIALWFSQLSLFLH